MIFLNKKGRRRASLHLLLSPEVLHIFTADYSYMHTSEHTTYSTTPTGPQNSPARSLNNYSFANKWLLVPGRLFYACCQVVFPNDGEFFELQPLICNVLF